MFSYFEDMPEGLINPGDVVYVISDILELSKSERAQGKRFDRGEFIDSIQKMVTSEGTILFPTFNWDFCKGVAFDYLKTPSKTGALTSFALSREDFKRTAHPLYSFAVWGKDTQKLVKMDNENAFGPGSVFDYMNQVNAKALVVGLHVLDGMTYVHHVEHMVGVPFRYTKRFTAPYIEADGTTHDYSCTMYVRDMDMDAREIEQFRPLSDILERDGVSKTWNRDGVPFHVISLRELDKYVRDDLINNDAKNLYVYNHIDKIPGIEDPRKIPDVR